MKLEDEVPVDTGTSDFTFDTRPDFEDDFEDFLDVVFLHSCASRVLLSLCTL